MADRRASSCFAALLALPAIFRGGQAQASEPTLLPPQWVTGRAATPSGDVVLDYQLAVDGQGRFSQLSIEFNGKLIDYLTLQGAEQIRTYGGIVLYDVEFYFEDVNVMGNGRPDYRPSLIFRPGGADLLCSDRKRQTISVDVMNDGFLWLRSSCPQPPLTAPTLPPPPPTQSAP